MVFIRMCWSAAKLSSSVHRISDGQTQFLEEDKLESIVMLYETHSVTT